MEAEVDDEMVGLHVANGVCYGFNSVAYRIWQIVEQPTSFVQICAILMEEFEVDAATCDADVRALLDELAKDGLVNLSAAD